MAEWSLWQIISCSWLNHFHRESYCGSSAQVFFSLIFVKKGDMWSKIGSRSSLYSLMHSSFLFLQKCSSWGQNEKWKSSTLCQQGPTSMSLSYNFVDRVGSILILSSNDLFFTLSCFSKSVRLANSKARIKPTAPLSAFNKENSIEFPLDLVHYIYIQSNPNPVLLSHASLWVNLLSCIHWYYKLKEKKKKKKRNNDLANLPSHDKKSFNKGLFGVSGGRHNLGAKVSTTFLFQQIKYVGKKTTLYYSEKCLLQLCYELVVTYCMVYHYTKRATLV